MIAPALQTEGKLLQSAQGVGMGSRGAAAAAHPGAERENGMAEKARLCPRRSRGGAGGDATVPEA